MTGEERTLSITGKFRNLMGADLERARRDLGAYLEEVHLGAIPFKELSKAAREFFGAAKDVPKLDIAAALAGIPQGAAQARDGYDALTTYAGGLDEVRRAAARAREGLAQTPKFDLSQALVGGSTEAVRQVDRVRAALAALGRPVADLAKQFAEPIARVKDFARQTGETLAFIARPVTAPIGWLKGALDQIFTVRTALAGFLAVSGVRAATNVVTDTIRQTADVARIAQSLNTSAESVSAIRFALQSVGVEGTRVITTFNLLEKAVAQASRGNFGKVVAFRDLGIDVRELKSLAPEELLARIARGLEGIDASSRAIALQPLFEESFRELIPLLGRGEEAFRRLVREAREFGGIISPKEAQQALEAERALLRIRTALDALKRAAVLDIAAGWAPGLEQLAKAIAENRDLVKGLAQAIAVGITTALDVASQAFIKFAGLLESIGLIDIIDEDKARRQIAALRQQLIELDEPLLEIRKKLLVGQPLPAGGDGRFQELLKREQELLRQIRELEDGLNGGVAGVLDGARRRMIDAVAQAREAVKDAAAAPQKEPLSKRPEPAPKISTEELPGFERRAALERERDLLRFRQQMLQLKPQTEAVRQEMARVGVELQKNAALSGDWGQTLTRAQIQEAVAAIEASFLRTGTVVRGLANEQGLAEFEKQLLEIGPVTDEVRKRITDLQLFIDSTKLTIDVEEGRLPREQGDLLREAQQDRARRERELVQIEAAEQVVRFKQELLSVLPASEEVGRALADLEAQAKRLSIDKDVLQGVVPKEQKGARVDLANKAQEEQQRRITEEFARSRIQAEQFLLGLEQQTPEVTQEVARLQAELQKLDLARLRREGLITEEQLKRSFAEIEKALARTKRQFELGGFFDGFSDGIQQATQQWTDFAAAGQRASQVISNSLSGAVDVLTDIQLGLTDDASEAWKEWGRNALRSIARVINELWAMYLVKLITGFFTAGVAGGAGSAGGQQIDIPSVPGGALDGGGALAAGGANGLLSGAGGLKRFGGGGAGTTRPGGYGNFSAGGGPGALGAGGGGGPVTIIEHHSHINLSAVDGESARAFLVRERRTIARLQADELERNLQSRDVVKRIR